MTGAAHPACSGKLPLSHKFMIYSRFWAYLQLMRRDLLAICRRNSPGSR